MTPTAPDVPPVHGSPPSDDGTRVRSPADREERTALGVAQDLVQWFTRATDMAQARAAARNLPDTARRSLDLAHLAAEIAHRTLKPVEPFRNGPPYAFACELYRQSTYWTLRSLLERAAAARDDDPNRAAGVADGNIDAVLRAANESGLLDASPELDRLRALVEGTSPTSFAQLAPSECRQRAVELRSATQLLRESVDPRIRVRQHWKERLRRGWLLVAAGAAAWVATLVFVDWWEVRNDLSHGKPWYVSSVTPLGCQSPEKKCDGSPDFFFHTRYQPEPWFMTDLGSVQTFSRVHVVNRRDCCPQRVTPLLVEVRGNDQEPWRMVARQDAAFEKLWRAEFAPVQARYVRLRVARYSYLHLAEVYVLP